MRILVTGAAGFIGSAVTEALLNRGDTVIAIDNLDGCHAGTLKRERLELLKKHKNLTFHKLEIDEPEWWPKTDVEAILHFAAQPGVWASSDLPFRCVRCNINAFQRVLEVCRRHPFINLIFASSSSVMNGHPLSIYGVTKYSNELMAQTYSRLFDMNITALRYFTVYGPWGRPDMAYWKFTDRILRGDVITLYSGGETQRDMTYITDAVNVTLAALEMQRRGYHVHNVGFGKPVRTIDLATMIGLSAGKNVKIRTAPLPLADVLETKAEPTSLELFGVARQVTLNEGVNKFVEWFKEWRKP